MLCILYTFAPGIQQSRSREPITRNGITRTRHSIDSDRFALQTSKNQKPKIIRLWRNIYILIPIYSFADTEELRKKRKKERKKNVMAAKDGGEGTIRKVGRCARAFYLAERRSPQSRVLVLRDRSPTLGHYKFSVAIESSPR